MPDETQTIPESNYGRKLRSHGLRVEADKIDTLIFRARSCDAHCGGAQAVAASWFKAEADFALDDVGPYEAIQRLTQHIKALMVLNQP
jgi:hypothetical protein